MRALDLPTMPHLTAATKNLCARGASQIEDVERKVAFLVICASIYLSGFLHTFLIPLVPSYHLITGAYFSTAEVSMLFASYSLGAAIGTPLTLFLAGHVKCWMMIATAQVVFFFNCIMFMAGSSFPILFLSRTIGGGRSNFSALRRYRDA